MLKLLLAACILMNEIKNEEFHETDHELYTKLIARSSHRNILRSIYINRVILNNFDVVFDGEKASIKDLNTHIARLNRY